MSDGGAHPDGSAARADERVLRPGCGDGARTEEAARSANAAPCAPDGPDVNAAPVYGRPQTMQLPPLTLDREEALGYVGYAGQEMDKELRARFERLADRCESSLSPTCVWALYQIDEERSAQAAGAGEPCVYLRGCRLNLPGRDISRHLDGAREAALMACTLGAESERELRKLASLSPTDELLYSAAGSALVEAAANAAEARIVADAAARGLRTNFRYSPGYGDLPLSIQPEFIKTLDATRRVGIVVNPGGLMVPTKSVTAVVGLFDGPAPEADVRSSCASCQLKGCCELRKRGKTCHG